jgi:hypothetical protein
VDGVPPAREEVLGKVDHTSFGLLGHHRLEVAVQAGSLVLSEFGQVAGSHAGKLDTDVSAPELKKPEVDDAPRSPGDEDFSSRSILR